MRILVIVLLVINLLFFGIGTYFDDIYQYIQPYIESSDQPGTTPAPGDYTILDTAVEQATIAEVASDTDHSPAKDAIIGQSASSDRINNANTASDTAPGTTGTATDNQRPVPTTGSVAESAAARVNLTNETAPLVASQPAASTPATTATAPKPESVQVKRLACVEFGPISKAKIAELRKIIGQLPKDSTIRTYARASNAGPFWVYLPAVKTLAEQQQQIAMLKQKGIKDYFIVQNDGNGRGAVSLGVFKSQELAKNLQKQLADQGIPARVGQKTMDMSYVRITQAPENIKNKYNIIRRKFPTAHTIGACQS